MATSINKNSNERELQQKIRELAERLAEANETLRAISEGEVDAVIVHGSRGEQVFSLVGTESVYRLIVETMKEAAFTVSFDKTILYCNAQFGEFVKEPMEQIVGHSLEEFVSEECKSDAASLLAKAAERPIKARLVFRASNGSLLPAHISANVLNHMDSMSICFVASDLTELENSTELIQQLRVQQDALRESEARFKTIFMSSNDAIFLIDDDGVYAHANPAAERLFDTPLDKLIGTGMDRYTAPDFDFKAAWSCFRREGTYLGDMKLMCPNGKVIDTESSLVANILPGRHLLMVRDITERKHMEDSLKQSHAELERAVEERTKELSNTIQTLNEEAAQRRLVENFLKNRSEQLRRMTAELNLTEQRERKRLAQTLHDGLQQILVGAKFRLALAAHGNNGELKRVAELIDDAINTSRSLTVELSPPILLQGDLLSALEWLCRWMQDKYELKVSLKSLKKIRKLEEGLLLLLFQAARELLFNIVKHAGVRTASVETDEKDGRILMTVEDQGAGFDPDSLQNNGSRPGGIGLFGISERLSYIGGQIEIFSSPGRGSRFRLVVPLPEVAAETYLKPIERIVKMPPAVAEEQEYKPADAEKKIRIMVVDDHIVMRQGLAGLLAGEPDFEVVGEASDGKSAVSLAHQIHPDVVLMDVSMPVMDGVHATRIIHRELPEICIIGLSMFPEGDQAAAMKEAGAVDYLTKSGPSESVIGAIRNLCPVY